MFTSHHLHRFLVSPIHHFVTLPPIYNQVSLGKVLPINYFIYLISSHQTSMSVSINPAVFPALVQYHLRLVDFVVPNNYQWTNIGSWSFFLYLQLLSKFRFSFKNFIFWTEDPIFGLEYTKNIVVSETFEILFQTRLRFIVNRLMAISLSQFLSLL